MSDKKAAIQTFLRLRPVKYTLEKKKYHISEN